MEEVLSPNEEFVRRVTAEWEKVGREAYMDVDDLLRLSEPSWDTFFCDHQGNGIALSAIDKIRLQGKLITRTNATHTGMLSLDNFIDWYWVTCDVWPSIKDSLGDEKKPPANFDLVWEDTILSAKLAFDTFDNGDTGLIPPEAMLEVAKVVWESKPSGEAITVGERVKLSEELLHYRQRANNGLMSFQDFTAWHSRISQTIMGIRSLKKKQKAAREVQQGTPEPENSTSPGPDDPLANMMFSIGDALDNLKKPAAAAASQPVPIQNGDTTATELRRAQLYASKKSPASPSKPALRSAEGSPGKKTTPSVSYPPNLDETSGAGDAQLYSSKPAGPKAPRQSPFMPATVAAQQAKQHSPHTTAALSGQTPAQPTVGRQPNTGQPPSNPPRNGQPQSARVNVTAAKTSATVPAPTSPRMMARIGLQAGFQLPEVPLSPVSPQSPRFPSLQFQHPLVRYDSSQVQQPPMSPVLFQMAPTSPRVEPRGGIHQSSQQPQQRHTPTSVHTPPEDSDPTSTNRSATQAHQGFAMPHGFEPAPTGEKAGIGITCGRMNNNDLHGAVYILAIHPNGPAAKTERLEAMQELLSVDGWSVYGQPMPTVMERVVGGVGTSVNIEVLTLASKGRQIFNVDIVRAQTHKVIVPVLLASSQGALPGSPIMTPFMSAPQPFGVPMMMPQVQAPVQAQQRAYSPQLQPFDSHRPISPQLPRYIEVAGGQYVTGGSGVHGTFLPVQLQPVHYTPSQAHAQDQRSRSRVQSPFLPQAHAEPGARAKSPHHAPTSPRMERKEPAYVPSSSAAPQSPRTPSFTLLPGFQPGHSMPQGFVPLQQQAQTYRTQV